MSKFSGKKLLILGGAFQHCKLVECARKMGVITYVTDYLPFEKAPAKQIADKYYNINITDIDDIVKLCRDEKIDGVLSTSLDPCQIPYYKICKELELPCYGTEEQFHIMTDKSAFKAFCKESGVDTIPQYTESDFESEDICNDRVEFPILIKPGVSRGSRGQTICDSYCQVAQAIEFAKSESDSGEIVIEKYMGQAGDFSMTLLVINGKAYAYRTVDRFLGKYEDGLDRLAVGAASPSIFTEVYLKKAQEKIENFIQKLGIVNAPIFMQGFVDGDTVRFYDPGLRLPGGEYERMFRHVFGRDLLCPLVELALTGSVTEYANILNEDDVFLDGKVIAQVLPTLRGGVITSVEGLDEIRNHPCVVAVFDKHMIGDTIKENHNVSQRFAEIDVVCDSNAEMAEVVRLIYDTLKITDENGDNMIVSSFDPEVFLDRRIISI